MWATTIGGVFALIAAVVGVFAQGTRSRSRKEVEDLLAIRDKVGPDHQNLIDTIVAWRIEGLTFITVRPRYWIVRVVTVTLLLGVSLGLSAISQHYSGLSVRIASSSSERLPARISLVNQLRDLSAKTDAASRVELETVVEALHSEIDAAQKETEDAHHYSTVASWLAQSAVALAVVAGVVFLTLYNVILDFWRRARPGRPESGLPPADPTRPEATEPA